MSLVKISALPVLTSIDAADLIPFDDVSATATKAITFANFTLSLGLGTAAFLAAGTGANQVLQLDGGGLVPVANIQNGMAFDVGWSADVGTGDKMAQIPAYVGGGGQPMDDAVIALVKVVIALKTALNARLLPSAA